MPDQYGFNHLGDSVRCIDCTTGGPIGQWPEHKRARHGRTHGNAQKQDAADARRTRSPLAAPPNDDEEKEDTTMATPTATSGKGEPAKQVAIDILRKAGEPLHAKEIAKRVLASGRCAGLKGKTPEATISAMLAVGSKPGGPFARVGKGTYTLADPPSTATSAKPAAKPPATSPARIRKPTRTQKPTRPRAKGSSAKRPR
jgi:hypothetical protein